NSSGWQPHPLECAHGWTPLWHRAKDRADAGQASKRSPIGDPPHLGTSAATARSAKAEIAESEYCSRFPEESDYIGQSWPLGTVDDNTSSPGIALVGDPLLGTSPAPVGDRK